MGRVFRIKFQHTVQVYCVNISILVITKSIGETTLSSSDIFCSEPEEKKIGPIFKWKMAKPLYLLLRSAVLVY